MARRGTGVTPVLPPEMPLTEDERRQKEETRRILIEATERLRQRNLAYAVRLAQAVAEGRMPELKDHFCELGRRFGSMLDGPSLATNQRLTFQVIKGGTT